MDNMPTLAEVDAYPVPALLVPRLMKLHGHTKEYAEGIVREAKRMLYLNKKTGVTIVPSEEVDDAWHAFILFTRSYQRFCDTIGGFVHHEPEPGVDEAEDGGASLYERYNNLLRVYEETLGEKPDPQYWTP